MHNDKIVSVVRVGQGDGECILAFTESGKVYTAKAGWKKSDQWRGSWSYLDWSENNPIPRGNDGKPNGEL